MKKVLETRQKIAKEVEAMRLSKLAQGGHSGENQEQQGTIVEEDPDIIF